MRAHAPRVFLSLALLLGTTSTARAVFLDAGRNFDVRFRGYSQVSVMAEQAREELRQVKRDANGKILWQRTLFYTPDFSPGDIGTQRNFYNPEFDAKLTDYTRWMRDVPVLSLFAPDEFKFRFAWWGFYDGIFDYSDPQWNRARNGILEGDQRKKYFKDVCKTAGCNPALGPMARQASSDEVRRESFRFNDESKNLNGILRHRNRINELYIDYTKGPIFMRIGRQAISWGESDSIAQLDVSNPFDLTQGAPGFFQDTDEARIPLWTFRSTIKLIDNWKEISSVFLDSYLVPGVIDTTVPITPSWFGMPYSQPGADPMVSGQIPSNLPFHVSIVDRLPRRRWSESRWGARLVGVLARDYTVSGWFFRTYPIQPAPQLLGPSAFDRAGNPDNLVLVDNRGRKTRSCLDGSGNPVPRVGFGPTGHTPDGRACKYAVPVVTQLNRQLESVIGLAATWFSQPVNGIIRSEVEYFIDENAVIPSRSLNASVQLPKALSQFKTRNNNERPRADILRWTFGYDTFFFLRALNPANSFVFSGQWQGAFNVSETPNKNFRSPQVKPGKPNSCAGPKDPHPSCTFQGSVVPDNFYEDARRFETFFVLHVETDYMHGRLKPAVTTILDPSGIFGFDIGATYRINDNLILSGKYLGIEGSRRTGLATFRDRDQFLFRLTYQLN